MKTNVRRHLRRTRAGVSEVRQHGRNIKRFDVTTLAGLRQAERFKSKHENAGDRVITTTDDGGYGNVVRIETIPDKNAKKTTARIFKQWKKEENKRQKVWKKEIKRNEKNEGYDTPLNKTGAGAYRVKKIKGKYYTKSIIL